MLFQRPSKKTNLKFEILGCFDPIKKITDTVKESIASGSPVMALFCLGMHESIAADTVNELLMDSNIVVSFEYWTPGEPGELDSYLDITNDRITCLLKDAIVAFEPYCEPDGAGYSCRIKFGVTWSDDFY